MKAPTIRSAFTLLETLLVLAVLGVVVLGSFSLTNIHDQGHRFDDNQYRLTALREAMVGSLESQVEECTLISGFVADMGRLPNNIGELINQGSLHAWSYDDTSNQWGGWRGPYLQSIVMQTGSNAFPDGWGNFGDTNNFGWRFEVDHNLGTVFAQSYGADGASGGSGYDLDFPINQFLIQPREALIDVAGWEVTVYLHNPEDLGGAGPALPAEDETYRVRLFYPEDGELDWPETWPPSSYERDEAPYLSESVSVATGSVSDGEALTLQFNFGENTKLVPYGIRTLALVHDDDGTLVGPTQTSWRVTLLSRMRLNPQAIAWNME